jgi:hypothetical protein
VKKLAKNNKGAVLIELAIALPVLLLIIFGGIELGLYFIKQHITARAIDSVVIPLQLNPNDPRREIEKVVRNSGMGFIDFSLGNRSGNYICARAYSSFDSAQQNRCKPIDKFDNGWHPEASYWLLNPTKPYYLAIAAHVEYKTILGIGGSVLPAINEWHVFQVSPTLLPSIVMKLNPPIAQSPTPEPPTAPQTPDFSGGGDKNDTAEINKATEQLQRMISNLPMLRQ